MTATPAYPALEALVDAYHGRANGRLVFKREGVERSVILAFRKVVFANSTEKKDRLELVLATRKLLRKEDVLRIAAKAKDSGVDFMTQVQREGVLKDVALFDIMSDRARDIIVDLTTWTECDVSQDPRGFSAEAVLPLNSDLMPLLVDGLMERFGAADCRRLLGSEDQVPKRLERPYLEREIRRSRHAGLAAAVLDRVDGQRAIVDVLDGLDNESNSAMKLLSVLHLLGAVDLPNLQGDAPAAAVPAPAPAVDTGVFTAPTELSTEEKAALSNIFEGATNLLEDDQGDANDLEIVVDDDGPGEETLELSGEAEPAPAPAGAPAEAPVEAPVEGGVVESEPAVEGVVLGEEPPYEAVVAPQVQIDFNALLDIDPDEAARLFAAGLELFQKGRLTSALEIYKQAIDKDPANPEYYSALGNAYLEVDPPDLQAAQAAFLEAVKLSPELPKNHYYLGKIYHTRGDNEAAAKAYEDALQRDAHYSPAKQALDALKGPAAPSPDKGDGGNFLRKFFGR
jgi:TolA-binding protein